MKRKWRLYLDASVLGGCFDTDEGWDVDSRRVVGYCIRGGAALLWTDTLEAELMDAPEEIRALYRNIPDDHRERVDDSGQVRVLMQSYLDAGVVGPRWWEDCLHVAAATVARADAIVSWNFKHIVRTGFTLSTP